jgi:hypothetical protein
VEEVNGKRDKEKRRGIIHGRDKQRWWQGLQL